MFNNEDNTAFDNNIFNSEPKALNSSSESIAIIGSKIRFKGELVGEEDLVIQGSVDGTIDLKGNNLTVGKNANLAANVSAKTIVVEGRVEGDIFGQEKVTIKDSSNVRGNIVAARVSLEDGAKFKGSIDMDVDDTSSTLNLSTPSKADSVTPITENTKKQNTTDSGKSKS
jgi:cytoskeletal protein CcmA (bactofilin family)